MTLSDTLLEAEFETPRNTVGDVKIVALLEHLAEILA